ncbi:hypothetical protein [Sphingomonas turrisvirgatae]|uniref:Uncharacterized protein n=1 Tax=Sphingomonas turrisvirgatae TaxID=1888892 RepID=A0A1E3LZA4_9SPHN|nr:hypothetical protein [Sphingomonas turrisvirgatae]ODP39101.1 hypothetical protein BFL28_12135 [Sphingomonas turrisvirgatae]
MLSFSQFENTLAGHFEVHDKQREKFRMRLKQLQRMGCPKGANNRRVTRMAYCPDHLLETTFVLELMQLGLSPERAIGQVRTWWDWLRTAFLRARDSSYPIVIAFTQGDFAGLIKLEGDAKPAEGAPIIGIDPADSADQLRQSLLALTRSRGSVINITDVLTGLTSAMKKADIESAFVWAATEAWRLEVDAEGRSLDPRKEK